MNPVAPKVTQKQVKDGLKADHLRLNRNDHACMIRTCDVLAGSVSFTESRHTGTKVKTFKVTWYTGIPSARWSSETCDTLKLAVAEANDHRQEAVNASAKELGDDFLTRDF